MTLTETFGALGRATKAPSGSYTRLIEAGRRTGYVQALQHVTDSLDVLRIEHAGDAAYLTALLDVNEKLQAIFKASRGDA